VREEGAAAARARRGPLGAARSSPPAIVQETKLTQESWAVMPWKRSGRARSLLHGKAHAMSLEAGVSRHVAVHSAAATSTKMRATIDFRRAATSRVRTARRSSLVREGPRRRGRGGGRSERQETPARVTSSIHRLFSATLSLASRSPHRLPTRGHFPRHRTARRSFSLEREGRGGKGVAVVAV
jgi:hypothetical protein